MYQKLNIPSIKQKEPLIKQLQSDNFWDSLSLDQIENLRTELRDLNKFLKDENKQTPIYTSIEDVLNPEEIKNFDVIDSYTSLQSYKDRVEHFIRKNRNHLVIDKLYRNIPITPSDLHSLETFFEHQQFHLKDIEKEYETQSLGVFIRKVLGMDIEAANTHFSKFIQEENLTADQMVFIEKIIHYLNKNGILDRSMLTSPPFNEQYDNGIFDVFEDEGRMMKVIQLVDEVSKNAGVA
ncbi:type I restriction-modification enzyme R subunit C-terminal domain-containing protein [Bergeyella sp. RCAD1439]|uniref:type I restriction-modification enzyme R subunit C-terminal domain-containing protein n=1 Tax=Bergeyella anatis TaxID=3113737 RepID=UPI002E178645|nr:type I restriction-modification enzyme R subunit C-terminal domain-containing protein [Bergeyella sp. RCAD1439]